MLERLKPYVVMQPNDWSGDPEHLKTISQKFNIFALMFHVFYLLYKRMWLFAGLFMLSLIALTFLTMNGFISQESSWIIRLSLMIWLGFEVADLERSKWKFHKFKTTELIYAYDAMGAKQRFLDKRAPIKIVKPNMMPTCF